MEKLKAAVVWLKRDLRLTDHAPLQAALATGLPVIILYVFEPSLLAAQDADLRHQRFIYESLVDINVVLPPTKKLWVCACEATAAFETLAAEVQLAAVFSYQETGNLLSFERDKQLAKWFLARNIGWHQFQNGGVSRPLANRTGWYGHWYSYMSAAALPAPPTAQLAAQVVAPPAINCLPQAILTLLWGPALSIPNPAMQPGGRARGMQYLRSFFEHRGKDYAWAISKPDESRRACSRVSPYLAYGCLSLREVIQEVRKHQKHKTEGWARPLTALAERLRWREHFVQKFESEHLAEFRNYNRGFDILSKTENPAYIQAWQQGLTGYPMVDASLRCVAATGYLNFRMRAMLVSFFCHILWQPWQAGVWWLGRQFLDYEIGIHVPQFQMQAGTVGIHTLRIYNPAKQGQDHDPHGHFVRKWVPELHQVPEAFIHTPWLLSELDRHLYKATDYPAPIVPWQAAYAHARDTLWKHKKHPLVQQEARRLIARHTFGRQMG